MITDFGSYGVRPGAGGQKTGQEGGPGLPLGGGGLGGRFSFAPSPPTAPPQPPQPQAATQPPAGNTQVSQPQRAAMPMRPQQSQSQSYSAYAPAAAPQQAPGFWDQGGQAVRRLLRPNSRRRPPGAYA